VTQTSVYRYYDAIDTLIYVGITNAGTARNQQHNKDKEWWPFVARQDVEHYENRDTAHQREVALIQAARPPFNVQHNPQHEEIRGAYFRLLELIRLGGESTKTVKGMALDSEKSMPLRAVVAGNETWFLTIPEYGGIIHALSIAKGAKAISSAGNVIGTIVSLGKIKNVARIVVKSSVCRGRGASGAMAGLTFVSLKKPENLGIKNIVIQTEV
jgi:predicted GIY-YIG superfamily endonuclease